MFSVVYGLYVAYEQVDERQRFLDAAPFVKTALSTAVWMPSDLSAVNSSVKIPLGKKVRRRDGDTSAGFIV